VTSFAQVAPGDTAAVIKLMRVTMSEIDSALVGFDRRDTVLATSPDSEPRRLSVWLQHGSPRKLTVSEPDDAGHMTGESSYWFIAGDLVVAQTMTSTYALDGGRIVLWTDAVLIPRSDVTPEERMAREQELAEQATKYLAAFGITIQ
jgi:hypothetical protein